MTSTQPVSSADSRKRARDERAESSDPVDLDGRERDPKRQCRAEPSKHDALVALYLKGSDNWDACEKAKEKAADPNMADLIARVLSAAPLDVATVMAGGFERAMDSQRRSPPEARGFTGAGWEKTRFVIMSTLHKLGDEAWCPAVLAIFDPIIVEFKARKGGSSSAPVAKEQKAVRQKALDAARRAEVAEAKRTFEAVLEHKKRTVASYLRRKDAQFGLDQARGIAATADQGVQAEQSRVLQAGLHYETLLTADAAPEELAPAKKVYDAGIARLAEHRQFAAAARDMLKIRQAEYDEVNGKFTAEADQYFGVGEDD